jgi:hypothetical protein
MRREVIRGKQLTMSPTDATVRELVDGLFERERSAYCYERLKDIGLRVAPMLLRALGADRLRQIAAPLVFSPIEVLNLTPPLYRIGDLLASSGLPEAVSHFMDSAASEDEYLREYGAWGLGNIASADCSEQVKRIFAAEERRVRIFTAIGVSRALILQRGQAAFFDAVAGSLNDFLSWEISDAYYALLEAENQQGVGAMSPAERNFFAASLYYFEVQNGGPWQYFGNSTANYHRLILAGLRAIGAPDTARTLESAGWIFGPAGPPEDHVVRNEMIDALGDEQVIRINDLYGTFPSGAENIEMLLFLYNVQHGPHFRTSTSKAG